MRNTASRPFHWHLGSLACVALLIASGCADNGEGSKDGSDAASADAASTANDAGTCDTHTPHGCYVAQAGNHAMCPAQSPEQSASYPPTSEWNGCNGIQPQMPFGQDPEAKCAYLGPQGQLATCVCDTGLHWLCACGAEGTSGLGTWPDCTTP